MKIEINLNKFNLYSILWVIINTPLIVLNVWFVIPAIFGIVESIIKSQNWIEQEKTER